MLVASKQLRVISSFFIGFILVNQSAGRSTLNAGQSGKTQWSNIPRERSIARPANSLKARALYRRTTLPCEKSEYLVLPGSKWEHYKQLKTHADPLIVKLAARMWHGWEEMRKTLERLRETVRGSVEYFDEIRNFHFNVDAYFGDLTVLLDNMPDHEKRMMSTSWANEQAEAAAKTKKYSELYKEAAEKAIELTRSMNPVPTQTAQGTQGTANHNNG